MHKEASKGLFVTFEGGDGAGKTTLIDKLYDYLNALPIPVIKTRAPGGTRAGERIRSLLLNHEEIPIGKRCELLLFLADRSQHVEEVIAPALQEGKIVLCDRFNDSTRAYQGEARGFDAEEVVRLCDFACSGLKPHLTLYLDLDPAIGLARVFRSKDRIESEALAFHTTIRKAFHAIASEEKERFRVIDATKSSETVFQEALEHLDAHLNRQRAR